MSEEYPKQTYSFRWYLVRWLCQFVDIVEGIIGVLSLGFVRPNWSLNIAFYLCKQQGIHQRKQKEKWDLKQKEKK